MTMNSKLFHNFAGNDLTMVLRHFALLKYYIYPRRINYDFSADKTRWSRIDIYTLLHNRFAFLKKSKWNFWNQYHPIERQHFLNISFHCMGHPTWQENVNNLTQYCNLYISKIVENKPIVQLVKFQCYEH